VLLSTLLKKLKSPSLKNGDFSFILIKKSIFFETFLHLAHRREKEVQDKSLKINEKSLEALPPFTQPSIGNKIQKKLLAKSTVL